MHNQLTEFFNARQALKRGTIIKTSAAISELVYLLLEGLVKESVVNSSGVEVTTRILKPEIVFPFAQPFEGNAVQFIYEAYTDVVVASVSNSKFKSALEGDMRLMAATNQALLKQVVDFKERLFYLNTGDALSKVVFILGYLSRSFSEDDNLNKPIEVPLSQKEIGLFIGLSRESVGMQIKKLAEKDEVSFRQSRLVINQPKMFLERNLGAGI